MVFWKQKQGLPIAALIAIFAVKTLPFAMLTLVITVLTATAACVKAPSITESAIGVQPDIALGSVPQATPYNIIENDVPVIHERISDNERQPTHESVIHQSEKTDDNNFDFDGDGRGDTVSVTPISYTRSESVLDRATLTVGLGNGTFIEKEFEGWWHNPQTLVADFDGDGKDDIALAMEVGGSNYGATKVHIFRAEGNKMEEMGDAVSTAAEYIKERRAYSRLSSPACVGMSLMQEENVKPLLRVRMLNDYSPGDGISTAYYVDLSFEGARWTVEDMHLGEAYGPDKFIEPPKPTSYFDTTLKPIYRPGFKEAELTVVGDTGVDIDFVGFNDYGDKMLSLRERAQIALRLLYDITGILIKRCNIDTSYGNFVCLTMTQDGNLESFLGTTVDPDNGNIRFMNIAWKQKGVEHSPLDPAQCVRPPDYQTMSVGEQARWYFENSSYGVHRAKIFRVEEIYYSNNNSQVPSVVKLHLFNGDFYEFDIDEATGLPTGFNGPYEKGYTH